jgi:hypothetical protein
MKIKKIMPEGFELDKEKEAYHTEGYIRIPIKKKVLPVNVWLEYRNGSIAFRTGKRSGYGFDAEGDWEDPDYYSFDDQVHNWELASKGKVNNLLVAEAEKRYPKGTKYRSAKDGGIYISTGSFHISRNGRIIESINCTVFKSGKWVDVVEDVNENKIPERFKRPLILGNFSIRPQINCIWMEIDSRFKMLDKHDAKQIVEYLKNHI